MALGCRIPLGEAAQRPGHQRTVGRGRVDDAVDVERRRHCVVDITQQGHELLVPIPRHAAGRGPTLQCTSYRRAGVPTTLGKNGHCAFRIFGSPRSKVRQW